MARPRLCRAVFPLFISAGAAVAVISLLHNSGGFSLVLGVNSIIALVMFLATLGLVALITNIEARHAAVQPAEIIQNSAGIRSSTLTRVRFFTSAAIRLRWHSLESRS